MTKEIIFLLYLQFEKVYIYKPNTSRLANSERYIICKNFIPLKSIVLFELINILNIWNHIDKKNRIQKYINIKIYSILNIEKDSLLDHQYQKFVKIIDDITKKFEKN